MVLQVPLLKAVLRAGAGARADGAEIVLWYRNRSINQLFRLRLRGRNYLLNILL